MKRTLLFLLLWSTWGFTLGTLLLLYPARWIVNYLRLHQYSHKTENMVMIGCIVVLAIFSFAIAWRSTNYFLHSTNKLTNALVLAIPILGAGLALVAFMNPTMMNARSKQEDFGAGFTIGAYPELDKMKDLKEQGYTTIISLLHPAVVPFEPQLLEQEKLNAAKAGIKILHIPMLPWISDNQASIDSLKRFAAANKSKCYIHCYLGKDRVNVARRIIEQVTGTAKVERGMTTSRKLDDIERFERGPIIRLEENVYLTPMPTEEEYLGYILVADFKQVVNLINTKDPEAQVRIREERKNLEALGIAYKVYDVNETTKLAAMEKIAKEVKTLPKPMIIHPFFSDREEARLFLEAYRKMRQ